MRLIRNAPGANPLVCFPPFGCFGDQAGIPLNKSETNQAYHLGVEHRVQPELRPCSAAWREASVSPTSMSVSAWSRRRTARRRHSTCGRKNPAIWKPACVCISVRFDVQSSIYDMRLTDEIHFRFGPNFEANNINLDPTRRYGWETMGAYRLKRTRSGSRAASPTRVRCSARVCSPVTTCRWSRAGPAMSAYRGTFGRNG